MTKDEFKNIKIGVISLGCDKNRVDLEYMLANLKSAGFSFTDNLYDSDVVLINSCAFIKSARDESYDNIKEVLELKKQGTIKRIVVTGCLPQKAYESLVKDYPEVDKFVKISDNKNIVSIFKSLFNDGLDKENKLSCSSIDRLITTPLHYSYLKIADGCNNCCSYCTIPAIRGRYKSRPIEDIVKEAKLLASYGVREINLVAQDLTSYGIDLYGKYRLVDLLRELTKLKCIDRYRLLYCYPELITDELLKEIQSNTRISKYIDIPLQHIDDVILKLMNRRCNEENTRKLIYNIKTNYPNIKIRSTFIVGFPGEDKNSFNKLCAFIKESKLDYVGFFKYSKEEYTKAYYLDNQIPERTKTRRLHKLQEIQKQVNIENSKKYLNKTNEIMIDLQEGNYYIGHLLDSVADVDFPVFIFNKKNHMLGDIVKTRITEFDNDVYIGEEL